MENNFSIYSSLKPINKDILITYTPSENVVSYQYRILKNPDNNLTTNNELVQPTLIYKDYTNMDGSLKTEINLTETGVYKLEVVENFIDGKTTIVNSGYYVIDKEAPKIEISGYKNQILEYKIAEDNSKIFTKPTAYDNYSGNLTNKISSDINDVDLTKTGIKEFHYTVSDETGNIAVKTVRLNVINNNIDVVHMWQIIIIICLIPIIIYMYFYNHAVKLEKKLAKYSVEPLKKYNFSLIDKFLTLYLKLISYIKNIISKSVFITKHSKKFDKYIGIVDKIHKDSMELIASKIIVSFIILFLAIVCRTVQFKILALEEFFIPLFLGYLLPDFYYIYRYKLYYTKLENDLLQAIIIMNNAFKSGRSITQAIELVTHQLNGPIAYEFKLMYTQLKLGISLENAFANFSNRIKIDEVSYLTASLSILNKTGGNIIKAFSSIEKTLFNKKKLKLELKSLTGSSRIIMYFLTALPIFLIIVIGLVNPDYFLSLYTTKLGFILLGIIFIIYISYIFIIRKIMRVRM